ncbi:3-hydroxyacyl-CoA dehydrogenase family protein [Hydrotalea sp.]|nr:3-hydroxyacyl-CoA dehydrogenase family protein [Hydrotalea sp.]
MHILIKANANQRAAFLQKQIPVDVQIEWYNGNIVQADAYFDFLYENEGPAFLQIDDEPVFVNAVITQTHHMPANFVRLNAWPSFLERSVIELVNLDTAIQQAAEKIMYRLNVTFAWCPDIPGMIAARAIASIINEAFFCLGDGVSSKSEIDIAMRLGTNYPMGPFEWAEQIGLVHVAALLKAMQQQSPQYQIAPLLLQTITD